MDVPGLNTPAVFQDRDLELVLAECHAPATSPWSVPAYIFQMRNTNGRQRMGRLSLRVAQTEMIVKYAGHIGYTVDEAFRGHRYAERSCRLILPLARAYGMTELWITCGTGNTPSVRTIERLGAQFVEIVDVPPEYPLPEGTVRKKSRYRLPL